MLRYHPKRADLRRWAVRRLAVFGSRTETARAMFTASAWYCLDMSCAERVTSCHRVPLTSARETKTHHPAARAVEPHHPDSELTTTLPHDPLTALAGHGTRVKRLTRGLPLALQHL